MTPLLTAFVPPVMHGTVFEEIATINGNKAPKKYTPRVHNGHLVVEVPLGFFLSQLKGPRGHDWHSHNPELIEWMGQDDRRTMFGNAFSW